MPTPQAVVGEHRRADPTAAADRQTVAAAAGGTALAEIDDAETSAIELGLDGETDEKAAKKALKKAKADGSTQPLPVRVDLHEAGRRRDAEGHLAEPQKQMVSYTAVVLAFLVFMVALIGLADLGLACWCC